MTARQEPFLVMAKPRGPICNLACQYCYFLSKEDLYRGSRFRMSDEVLERYTRQLIDAHELPELTFAWQGGEATLMGIDFFRRAVALQKRFCKPGMRIRNALQTNGTTLNEEWCRFLSEESFLVGISIDGPRPLHDAYRVDRGGRSTFARVMRGLELVAKHGIEFNVLTTVHAANASHPRRVYEFLRDRIGARFIQFIPIVEADHLDRSVTGQEYGDFLNAIFDEWVRNDVARVFVQIFDVALAAWSGHRPGLCIFEKTCGNALVVEHNGDLYSCDHYVDSKHLLGNINDVPMATLAWNEEQKHFGQEKLETLSQKCRACKYAFVCNGGCPKNRFVDDSSGVHRQNYLCDGYLRFFAHVDTAMQFMAGELRARRSPANIMATLAPQEGRSSIDQSTRVGRNEPCPCGSGRKYKRCHA